MNIKKILLIILPLFCLCGCVRLGNLNYDEIMSYFDYNPKSANVFRNGYKLYVPKGLNVSDAGLNYMILSSVNSKYYIYFDLVAFSNKEETKYETNSNYLYSKIITKGNISGYINIKNIENDKYLIEIVYNYAKIEVMVDSGEGKEALLNAINILNSIKYDEIIIENLLKDDSLNYTEEIYDMFEKAKDNSNILDYSDESDTDLSNEEIIDTDFIN